MLIDYIAYNNRFSSLHPLIKFSFFVSSITSTFLASSTALIFYFVINLLFLIFLVNLKVIDLTKIFLPFILFGLILLFIIPVNFEIKGESLLQIKVIFMKDEFYKHLYYYIRALTCVSILLIFSLTTPFLSIIHVLRMIKFPSILLDLMIMSYLFVFVLYKKANEIYISQISRLGYTDLRSSYIHLSQLVRSEYTLSLDLMKWLLIGAQTRHFTGQFNFLPRKYDINLKYASFFIGLSLLYLLLAMVGI